MKRKLLMLLILTVLATTVSAQESLDQTISRLETEIGVREKVDNEPTTPAAQKVTNRANLDKARTALVNAVQTKIAALEKYLNNLGPSITPEEKVDARAALRTLSTVTNRAVDAGNGPVVQPESSVEAPDTSPAPVVNAPVLSQPPAPPPATKDNPTAFTRAIIGLEQAAAASAKPEQKLFLEFNLSAPLGGEEDKPLTAPVWLWLNPRFTSLPRQLTGTVAEFMTASNFLTPFNAGKVNDIVQGFEFLGGAEFKLGGVSNAIKSGFGDDTKVRFGLSLVVAAGMATPLGSQQVAPQFFKVNSTVSDAFPGAKGKDFIAFVNADRNRFFRQYYGGLRLKSYYVKNSNHDELDDTFPGIIDLTFGQNETVTGGSLHGGVVRIDGIYPLPFAKGVYVFGSALMKLSKPKIPPPIILQIPEKAPEFPSDNVFIQQVPARDADHYRIGVGVDLIRLLKKG